MRAWAFIILAAAGLAAAPAFAAGNVTAPESIDWSHNGPFGTFDRAATQRGLLVYKEVCAGCHSLKYVAFRTLADIGLSEEEVKAFAAESDVTDGPDEDGEMFTRPAKPSDKFPSPFANENAARAANGGAAPPDLSLMTKARNGASNYLYSLLTGYADAPDGVELAEGMSYNPYFTGHQIAMPPPLSDDAVEYADGTKATVDQMAYDVVSFLAWTAEPEMEDRKRLGVKVVLFLVLFSILMYAVKRKVWADVH